MIICFYYFVFSTVVHLVWENMVWEHVHREQRTVCKGFRKVNCLPTQQENGCQLSWQLLFRCEFPILSYSPPHCFNQLSPCVSPLALCACQVFMFTQVSMSDLLTSYEQSTKPAMGNVSGGSAERRKTRRRRVKQRREIGGRQNQCKWRRVKGRKTKSSKGGKMAGTRTVSEAVCTYVNILHDHTEPGVWNFNFFVVIFEDY